MKPVAETSSTQSALGKDYVLALFFRVLAIGAVAEIAASLIMSALGLPLGVAPLLVGIAVFGCTMAPLLYFGVIKEVDRRVVAQRQEHERMAATARDQALLARADQARLALQTYVETVVASVPSALLMVSSDLIVRSVSQSFRELFNLGDRDVVGQPVEKILPLSGVWRLVAEILGSDDPHRKVSADVPDPVRNRDFHVTLTKLPQPDQDARLLLVVEDITERKRLLEQVEASRARFWGIVAAASDAIVSVDEHQRIVIFNQHAEDIFGYPAREVIGQPLAMLLPSRFREGHQAFVGAFHKETTARRTMSQRPVLLGLRKTGEEFPVEITISKLMSEGQLLMTAIVRDISEREKMERELRKSENALQTFLDNASDLVQNVAADGRFVYVNRAWLRALGYASEELAGLTVFDIIHADSRAQYRDLFERVLAGESLTNVESIFVAKDGRSIPVEGHITAGSDDRVVTWAIFRDMTERKLAEARLNHLAHHDSLTGLPNRLLFVDRLTRELARARRAKQLVGLLFLDLDGFKPVNDALGHDSGDTLLKAVAQRLARCVRASDTIARLGGDEFTVILHDLNSAKGAAVIAEKILHALAQPFLIEGRDVSVTASIGITMYPLDSETVEGLLKHADTAMYRAKAAGNAYRFFAPKTQEQAVDRWASSVQDLHQALEQRVLTVRYQPYVALDTRSVVGGCAHVQWHRRSGVVPQPDVLRLALEGGLLTPITRWLLHTACTDACAWQSSGSPLIRVSVPLSRQQFALNHLVDSADRALRESSLDPACLNLELDEGIFLFETENLAVKLRALRGLGLTFSIADFGAGYAPLADLTQYAIDGLKIGRELVSRLMTDPDCAAAVRGIIAIAHELEMSVVADGVENESQAAWLRTQRCEMIQGDLVAGLLSAEALRRMTEGVGGFERPAA